MSEDKYKHKKISLITECDLDSKGWWNVKITTTQARSTDGEIWEEVDASVRTVNRDLDQAMSEAYLNLYYYGDLFEQKDFEDKSRLN